MMLTQIDQSPHYLTAMPGNTPTPGAGDFGDQAMGMATSKDTADLSALFSCVAAASLRMQPRLKLPTNIAVGKTSKRRK
jgi:hypothetical protein